MAGDWIKVEHALPDKPEVIQMATTLGIDSDAVVGKLIRVWTWFDNHTEDGNAPVTVRALLERYTGVTGFVTSMLQVGWIHENDGMLSVSHFDRHNGQSAKNRANTNRRVTKSRKCNDASVTNVTGAALQKPLPEKRREEKSVCVKSESHTPTPTDFLISRFNSCHPSYSSPALSAKEQAALNGTMSYAETIPPKDWLTIAEWMLARVDWKPKNRLQLIDNIDQCHTYALDWRRKNPVPQKRQKPAQEASSCEIGMTPEEVAAWIEENKKPKP